MVNETVLARVLDEFPAFHDLYDEDVLEILAHGRRVSLPVGSMVFRDGEACSNYLFVLSGRVRVQKITHDGHELTLYRLVAGQACELTTSCLMAGECYHAEAVAETPVEVLLVCKNLFDEAMGRSSHFRHYVFSQVEHGMNTLLRLLEAVAFEALDKRLAQRLLDAVDDTGEVHATHHELAVDLGSAREVISRTLKALERKGLVRLGRGHISLLDTAALRRIALKNE